MIKSCVIGLSKIGQIHCNNLKKIKNTSLNYVYDKDFTLRNKTAKKFNQHVFINKRLKQNIYLCRKL